MSKSISSVIFQSVQKLWDRFTAPSASLTDPDQRRQARILASLALALAATTLLLIPLLFVADTPKDILQPRLGISVASAAFLLFIYLISRRGRYRSAALLPTVVGSIIVFAGALATGQAGDLYFLIAMIIFASLFFTFRFTVALLVIHWVFLLIFGLIQQDQLRQVIEGPFSFNFFVGLLTLLATYYQKGLERQRRKQLSESEERYRAVSELVSDYAYSFLVLPDGRLQHEWVTDSYHRLTGYQPGEMVSSLKLYHPADLQQALKNLQQAISGSANNGEYRIVTKMGESRWIRVHRRPIWDDHEQRVIRLYGVVQDITESKLSEARLFDERNLLRTLIDHLPDPVFVKDRQSRFVNCNMTTARHLKAAAPSAVIGKTDYDFMPTDEADHFFQEEQALMTSGKEAITSEHSSVDADGSTSWFLTTKIALRGADGQVTGLVGINRDMTGVKNSEANRHKLEVEQERLNVLNHFIRAVSHDFRTSLAIIETSRYLTGRLLAPDEQAKVKQNLDKIQESVNHLTEQLDNLYTIYSLANLKIETFDLNSALHQVVQDQRSRVEVKKQRLHFDASAVLPPLVGDSKEIAGAVHHLLVNAIRHTPEGGKIDLRTYCDTNAVMIAVSDSGPGIDPKHLPYIFDLFYRTDAARTVSLGGIGVGLSIVKMVADAHGGEVRVESEPGQGSVFTIALPVKIGAPN